MFKLLFTVECIIGIISCFVCCYGKPVADFGTADHVQLLSKKDTTLLQLQNLLDEALLKEIYVSIQKQKGNLTIKEATPSVQYNPQTQKISNSKPKRPSKPLPPKPPISTIPSFGDRIQEVATTPNKSPLEYNPQKPSFAGSFSNGQLSQLIPPGLPLPANPQLPNRIQDETNINIKPDPQRPSFAGSFSSGQSNQLIPPGKPWPANPQLPNRIQDSQESTINVASDSQRPSFAGSFSSGQLSQRIPPGRPLPAGPSTSNPTLEDRFQQVYQSESDKKPVQRPVKPGSASHFIIFEDKYQEIIASTTTKRPFAGQLADDSVPTFEDRFKEVLPSSSKSKSPLEYNGQRPSFAGQFSNGQPIQLIPSGNPLPAGPLSFVPVKDRFEDDNEDNVIASTTTTKSPLEYNGQRPSFASQFSNGQPIQLIPSGNPLPAGPLNFVPVKDRFEEDSGANTIPSTKSPLEYNGQRPSFVGQFSNGQPSQLIPSGNPLPAGPLSFVPVKDRFEDDNKEPQVVPSTTTKSPLDYNGQKPSFAGQFSNGQLSQLIPSGNPLPAGPLGFVPVKDRFEEDNVEPVSTTTKSPLEYNGQRPSFAGQFSNGQPSQLIPSGNPLPAGPSSFAPVKDRFEDDNEEPQVVFSTTTKSPLEYNGQRPSFAGQFSNGQPSQLIPSGNPLPARPPSFVPVKDRFEDDNEEPQPALSATTKSPLEYNGQRPSFAGQFSNGQPSQLIPSGNPLPAGPLDSVPIKDRFKEDSENNVIASKTTTKSPLEYNGQRPSFAGQFSNGQPSQLIPSGNPLPAGPLSFVPVKDRFEEDNEDNIIASSTTTKSPLEYHGQRPSFAGQFSNGQRSQLIPSGNPLPAGPLSFVPVKDRFEDDNEDPQVALSTTTKSPLEYNSQRPSFTGQFSNGQPSQLIPSGNPLPAGPSGFVPVKDRFEDDNEKPQPALLTTTKSPLEYNGQRPSFAGQFSNGQPSQLIPSGNPLPAAPLNLVPVKDRFEEDIGDNAIASTTATKSPLEYNGQRPSFAGEFSNGQPSQLIPSGNPLPAGPMSFVPVNDRFDDNEEPQPTTTTKSPLEYNGQRPSFAGQFSNGQPSQLIPSGNPLPAGPSNSASVKDRLKEDEKPAIAVSIGNKPPLEYILLNPLPAISKMS